MRVLLDATRIGHGGGLQVALSVFRNAALDQGEWHAALSPTVAAELDGEGKKLASIWVSRSRGRVSEMLDAYRRLPRLEATVKPDVVFTIFGPTLWRPRSPHLVGFALGNLIYPEVRRSKPVQERIAEAWQRLRMRGERDWVVETDVVRKRLALYFHVDQDRISVIPNSVSPQFLEACEEQRDSIRNPGQYRVLVPSEYYPHKCLELVPEIARELRGQGLQDFRFVFTVGHRRGWRRILQIASDADVDSHFENAGRVPHNAFASLYLSADVVLLPTLVECSTAVYPEAFSAGRPVVTTDADFARALCGDAARYFPANSASIAAGHLMAIARSREERMRLVEAGERVLSKHYVAPAEKWRRQVSLLRSIAREG